MGTGSDMTVLAVVVGIIMFAFVLWALSMAGRAQGRGDKIDCPECDGGKRPARNGCPTCAGRDQIRRGGNNPVAHKDQWGMNRIGSYNGHKFRTRTVTDNGRGMKIRD